MNHAGGVDRTKRIADLNAEGDGVVGGQRTGAVEARGEGFTKETLHHQVRRAVREHSVVVDFDDVRCHARPRASASRRSRSAAIVSCATAVRSNLIATGRPSESRSAS